MWIPKWQRDRQRGVDSPVPTQVVSNEEFIPRPQNELQKQWERRIGELADDRCKKLNMDRRAFMASSMGMATAFLAANEVFGPYWEVDAAETFEPQVYEEKWPKGEYFIFDVQTHFTNGQALRFRNAEFLRNMGFDLKSDAEAYSFTNFVKELFFDSETGMIVISGVPGREIDRNARGQKLEGPQRGGGILPKTTLTSWQAAHGLCAKETVRQTTTGTAATMRRTTSSCSSKWSARSSCIKSTRGNGTATPILAGPVTVFAWMTKN